MEIQTITSKELVEEIMKYIREVYSYSTADITDDNIQITNEVGEVVNIYINVEGEDE